MFSVLKLLSSLLRSFLCVCMYVFIYLFIYFFHVGTLLVGYYQSWKYFQSAQEEVRKVFKFPNYANKEALRFISNIRRAVSVSPRGAALLHDTEVATTAPLVTIVAVHVRLGDKISKNITAGSYNHWSLSVDYYLKAIHLVQQRRRGTNRVLAYAIFIGGSVTKDKKAKDVAWTKKNIGKLLWSTHIHTLGGIIVIQLTYLHLMWIVLDREEVEFSARFL